MSDKKLEDRIEEVLAANAELLRRIDAKCIQIEDYQRALKSTTNILESYQKMNFPVCLRKMWTGEEVQRWLDDEHERIKISH